MTEFLLDPNTYLSLITLTALEIILGIDNILFISIVCSKLPAHQQETARKLGLSLALFGRLALLFSLSWLLSLNKPLFQVLDHWFSGRDLVLGIGGLFLLYKATQEIFQTVEGITEDRKVKVMSFGSAIAQILVLDIVFSLDSVITAIGLASQISIMAIAIFISIVIMVFASRHVSAFLDKNPSMKVLGLSFLLLISVLLLADSFGQHVSRTYVYFALGFSAFVELMNLRARNKAQG
ncbi:MAG: TerC family protein [Deltaproteobacteria bacterium]|nr:TerC family protein [Deltaproteobacteria bacterium]